MLSTRGLSRSEMVSLFERAKALENLAQAPQSLKDKTMVMLFEEPSTRTFVSFHKAMQNLGGKVIAIPMSSIAKGESMQDTIHTLECFADVIVLRLRQPIGSIASKVPVINAGDGSNEHPTQALTDIYTIWKRFGNRTPIFVTLFGDLRYSRVAHSLKPLLRIMGYVVSFAPGTPELNDESETCLSSIPHSDVVYVTRSQVERWPVGLKVVPYVLPKCSPSALILHPLPRGTELTEIPDSVWEQVRNGVFIRMAVLEQCLFKRTTSKL